MQHSVGEDGGLLSAELGDVDEQSCPRGKNWRRRDHGSIIVRTVGSLLSLAEGLAKHPVRVDRGKRLTVGLRSITLETGGQCLGGVADPRRAGDEIKRIPQKNVNSLQSHPDRATANRMPGCR
jgi:hypothetical protein